MRDTQPIYSWFPELLRFQMTKSDAVYQENKDTLFNFLARAKKVKLEMLKKGKKPVDLFELLLSEGAEIYEELGDRAEEFLFDDISNIFVGATSAL
jgi:hypothetical protein